MMMVYMTDHTNKSAAAIQAEIDQAKLAREGATGGIKAGMTRQIKALQRELAEAQAREGATPDAAPKLKLADLEQQIAEQLRKQGATEATAPEVKAIGNPVVLAGRLTGYTADRYGNGEWISPAVLRRITKLLA